MLLQNPVQNTTSKSNAIAFYYESKVKFKKILFAPKQGEIGSTGDEFKIVN